MQFWASVSGAIVGGAIAALVAWVSAVGERRAGAADREEERAHARLVREDEDRARRHAFATQQRSEAVVRILDALSALSDSVYDGDPVARRKAALRLKMDVVGLVMTLDQREARHVQHWLIRCAAAFLQFADRRDRSGDDSTEGFLDLWTAQLEMYERGLIPASELDLEFMEFLEKYPDLTSTNAREGSVSR